MDTFQNAMIIIVIGNIITHMKSSAFFGILDFLMWF